jgi:hypothetical protein
VGENLARPVIVSKSFLRRFFSNAKMWHASGIAWMAEPGQRSSLANLPHPSGEINCGFYKVPESPEGRGFGAGGRNFALPPWHMAPGGLCGGHRKAETVLHRQRIWEEKPATGMNSLFGPFWALLLPNWTAPDLVP